MEFFLATVCTSTKNKDCDLIVGLPTPPPKMDDIYSTLNVNKDDKIQASVIGPFFRKSKLPSTALSKIWTLCDVDEKGFLTKSETYKALDLVLMEQKKSGIIGSDNRLPVFHFNESGNSEMDALAKQFAKLEPKDGKINGSTTKTIMKASNLSVDKLRPIL